MVRSLHKLLIFGNFYVWPHSGMKLPNSEFVGCEEEEVATALGSVCHVVQLISKYLGVRHPFYRCLFISILIWKLL